MSGWFLVARGVFDHPMFLPEPMTEREAWLWLIARAAWKDTQHRVGGDVVPVPRGSLFCTLRELQAAWGWRSDTRVRAFLGRLENERMIQRETNAGKTQITICNYSRYQVSEREENAEKTHEERTENALKKEGKEYNIPSLRSGIDDECASASTPVFPEKQKKPPDKSRGFRLPIDWHPGSDWLQFTRKEGLNDDDAKRELENFRDYWAGIPGSRGTKLDWPATWRNRVREVASRTKRLPRASPTGGSRGEPASLLRAVQRAADRYRAPDDVSRDGAGVFDRDGLVVDIATRRG